MSARREDYAPAVATTTMHSARDQRGNREWLARIDVAIDGLELGSGARSYASDMFLTRLPDEERSKQVVVAVSLYADALTTGEGRFQTVAAESTDVSQPSIQQRWKDLLREAGLRSPSRQFGDAHSEERAGAIRRVRTA